MESDLTLASRLLAPLSTAPSSDVNLQPLTPISANANVGPTPEGVRMVVPEYLKWRRKAVGESLSQ